MRTRRGVRGEGPHDAGPRTLAGGVQHDDVGPAQRGLHQRGRDLALEDAQVGEGGAVVPGVGAGAPVPLHGQDRARRAHRVGQRDGEQAGAGVEVGHRRAPSQSPATSRTAAEQRRRRRRCGPARRPRARSGRCARRRRRARRRAAGGPSRRRRAPVPMSGRRGADLAARRDRDHRLAPARSRSTTSSSVAPGHRTARAPVAVTAGLAMGHSWTYSSRWERWRRNPTAPRPSTATRTRLRQPSPAASPGTGSTSTARSRPARRSSCSAMRKAFSRRCAPTSTCWKSQPPQRPGPACGQGGSTRSGEGVRISTASARR